MDHVQHNDDRRAELLGIAVAQRQLSMSLLSIPIVIVGSISLALITRDPSERLAQILGAIAGLYIIACGFQLSRALGFTRGLRWTLAVACLVIPFSVLIVSFALLYRARRRLRDACVDAGFFMATKDEINLLRPDPANCPSCGYSLLGLLKDAPCPECGKPRSSALP